MAKLFSYKDGRIKVEITQSLFDKLPRVGERYILVEHNDMYGDYAKYTLRPDNGEGIPCIAKPEVKRYHGCCGSYSYAENCGTAVYAMGCRILQEIIGVVEEDEIHEERRVLVRLSPDLVPDEP